MKFWFQTKPHPHARKKQDSKKCTYAVCRLLSKHLSTAGKTMVPWNLIGGVTLIGHSSYENFFSAHDNCVWILNFRFWSNSIDQSNPESWHGVTLIDLLCTFTSKDYFYLKNKFQEVTEKNVNVLYTEMQGYYSNFKYWNFQKTLKINQSNPVSR